MELEGYGFSESGLEAMYGAIEEARRRRQRHYTPAHLALATLRQPGLFPLLSALSFEQQPAQEGLLKLMRQAPPDQRGTDFLPTPETITPVLQRAQKLATERGIFLLDALDLFFGLTANEALAELLGRCGADAEKIRRFCFPQAAEPEPEPSSPARSAPRPRPAPRLQRDPVIGRAQEVRKALEILSTRQGSCVLLVGDVGVGKTTILTALARRIVEGSIPHALAGRPLLMLDPLRYTAEENQDWTQLKRLSAQKSALVFIDDFHLLPSRISDQIRHLLQRGTLACLATTTPKYAEGEGVMPGLLEDDVFSRRFEKVMIEPPSVGETISLLRALKERYEAHHRLKIKDSALVWSSRLADRYFQDRHLPQSALSLLDEACSRLSLEQSLEPARIDDKARQLRALEHEEALLKREALENERELEALLERNKNLRESIDKDRARARSEKNTLQAIKLTKAELERAQQEAEQAQARFDYERASKLNYDTIPALQLRLKGEMTAYNALIRAGQVVRNEVTEVMVAEIIEERSGVPAALLVRSGTERIQQAEQTLSAQVIGQPGGVEAVVRALRRAYAGLNDPERPVASFLFMGPTGVGKTELVKAIAELLFDDRKAMIRIDMSEYSERHSSSRLIGSPPGYVGYDQGGQLTEAIRKRPYAVVLLDELDKAHPEVAHLFLQLLDEGFLTDGQGKKADFRNAIVIFTSNIGAEQLLKTGRSIGFSDETGSMDRAEQQAMEALRHAFKPELPGPPGRGHRLSTAPKRARPRDRSAGASAYPRSARQTRPRARAGPRGHRLARRSGL